LVDQTDRQPSKLGLWSFCYLYLRNFKGFTWNHKRVYRIYKELELNLCIKPRKRLVREKPEVLTVPLAINQVWSMDFMHDQLEDGITFRLFNVIDDFNRKAIGMEVDFSLPSERVIRELKQIISWRSKPEVISCDNGKEFADHQAIDQALGIKTYFAYPYCSWQRGSNENFNGLLRQYFPKKRRLETVTDEELTMIENRLNHRPRKLLGFKTPHEVFHASLNHIALRS
jgi:putative transposase